MNLQDKYLDLREGQEVDNPKVSFQGTIYPWFRNRIHISSIHSIVSSCTYRLGMEAKQGYKFEASDEERKPMDEGTELHDRKGDSLGIDPKFDFRKGNTFSVDVFKELENRPNETVRVLEVPIPGIYKNLRFSGKLDTASLTYKGISKFEEWKFYNKGKIIDSHRTQSLIYAYFIYKWLDIIDIPYEIKFWTRGLDRRDYNEEPNDTKVFILSKPQVSKAEGLLDQVTDIFTGKIPCIPDPGFNCYWCNGKDYCPHAEKKPTSSLIDSLRIATSKI